MNILLEIVKYFVWGILIVNLFIAGLAFYLSTAPIWISYYLLKYIQKKLKFDHITLLAMTLVSSAFLYYAVMQNEYTATIMLILAEYEDQMSLRK